ncbi:MAG: exo-alpha-sialidase [Sedimentisphaeraceae bacterium JB056]
MKKAIIPALLATLLFAGISFSEEVYKACVKWDTTWPDPEKTDAGLEILSGVEHFTIFTGSRELGMFNHGPIVHYYNNKLFVTWFSHDKYEGGPGTRALFAFSEDMKHWSKTQVLIDSIGKMAPKNQPGVGIYPIFKEVNGRLYTTATVKEVTEWVKRESGAITPVHHDLPRLIRYISPEGIPGKDTYWLSESIPPGHEKDGILPYTMAKNKKILNDITKLKEMRNEHKKLYSFPESSDKGTKFCEPTYFFRPDGKEVGLYRDDSRSMRLYAALRNESKGNWSMAYKTNIPDSPSKCVAGNLPDGRAFLIGNNIDRLWLRDPLILSISEDGINFTKAYTIRCGAPQCMEKNPGDHKGPGFQYPNAIVVDDTLWVTYSIGKEQIGISKISIDLLK